MTQNAMFLCCISASQVFNKNAHFLCCAPESPADTSKPICLVNVHVSSLSYTPDISCKLAAHAIFPILWVILPELLNMTSV